MYQFHSLVDSSAARVVPEVLPEQRSLPEKRRGMVITVGSPGYRSVATLNLASYLGLILQDRRVCVVELNFQSADTGKYLNVYNPNVTYLARDRSLINREEIGRFLIHRPDCGFSALLGPATILDTNPEYIHAALYAEILSVLKQEYDYIFLTGPRELSLFTPLFQQYSDRVLVPISASPGWGETALTWARTAIGLPEGRVPEVFLLGEGDVAEQDRESACTTVPVAGRFPSLDQWDHGRSLELLSVKNIPHVNEALSGVLYHLTGEEALLTLPEPVPPRRGIIRRLFHR